MSLSYSQIEDAFATTDEDINSLLSNILILNLENDSSEKVVTSIINKLLANSKSRLVGLKYLNLLINHCSSSVISENAFTWLSHCLINYSGDTLKEIKLSTVGKIIENGYNRQEFTKKFISDYISKVFENCLSAHGNSYETEASLQTLTICMKYYGSWFAPHRMKIEKFLVGSLDDLPEKLIEKAAVAFHYLQQTGGAGKDGINHITNFSISFEKLCASVHTLLDTLLENETEMYHGEKSKQEGFDLIILPDCSQKTFHVIARRIIICFKFMITMLLRGFPVAKEIKPIQVLDVIKRATAIHHCLSTSNEKSLKDFQFSLLLIKIQLESLQLLRTFIVWGQVSLLPVSFNIFGILIDSLNKSQNCQCFKTDCLYQQVAYTTLSSWLTISPSTNKNFQNQLVTCILKDITPVMNHVTLTLQTDAGKNKSKKAKRKAVHDRIISNEQHVTSTEHLTAATKIYKEKICVFALNTLKELLIATTLNTNELKNLMTSIISIMMDIQTSKIHHPYTNTDCQAKLYEVLVAFYEQDTSEFLPPIQLTIEILNRGVNNKNRHIASKCKDGLRIVEKFCQPDYHYYSPEEYLTENSITVTKTVLMDKALEEFNNQIDGENDDELSVEEILHTVNENVEIQIQTNQADTDIGIKRDTIEDEAEAAPKTLLIGRSLNVLDVQVIKTSFQDVTENIDSTVEEMRNDKCSIENEAGSSQCSDLSGEISILKREVLSNTSIVEKMSDLPELAIEHVEKSENDYENEPPQKKSRVEIVENVIEIKVDSNFEEIDDTFEEDDAFVDEIKKY